MSQGTRDEGRSNTSTDPQFNPSDTPQASNKGTRFRAALFPTAFLLAIGIVWELIAQFTDLFPAYLLPAPTDIIERMWNNPALLWSATQVTLIEVVAGFLIGVVLGLLIALPIAYSPTVRATLYPLIVASQAVPKIAIGPLLVLWLGLGITPKLAIVALMVFFPIVITAAEGFSSVDRNLVDLMRSVDASPWQVFRRIRLPHAIPQIFSGLKIGITLAVVGAVVGEWISADDGLGYLLLYANSLLDSTLLFAALTILVALGVVLFILIELAERVLLPWRTTASDTSRPN